MGGGGGSVQHNLKLGEGANIKIEATWERGGDKENPQNINYPCPRKAPNKNTGV